MGRAYLAETSRDEREEILERVREFDETKWPSIRDGVMRSLEEYRTIGCCTSFGDWQPDVNAIAIAFQPANGTSILSINCGGPAFTISPDFLLNEVKPRLLDLVDRLRRL
jgi:DNA-binding IclR family transcriptional regulator